MLWLWLRFFLLFLSFFFTLPYFSTFLRYRNFHFFYIFLHPLSKIRFGLIFSYQTIWYFIPLHNICHNYPPLIHENRIKITNVKTISNILYHTQNNVNIPSWSSHRRIGDILSCSDLKRPSAALSFWRSLIIFAGGFAFFNVLMRCEEDGLVRFGADALWGKVVAMK